MKQENTEANIGIQTAKEREAVRQLSHGCIYLVIFLTAIIALILYLVM